MRENIIKYHQDFNESEIETNIGNSNVRVEDQQLKKITEQSESRVNVSISLTNGSNNNPT